MKKDILKNNIIIMIYIYINIGYNKIIKTNTSKN